MSTESNSDDEEDSGVLAPDVNTDPPVHRMHSPRTNDVERTDLTGMGDLRESLWMESYDGDRNLFDALGYVEEPEYKHYRARYERTDTAPALVDKLPKKAWSEPTILDPGSPGSTTEFEKAVNKFLAGDYTDEDPINVMERASRMERLGQFALIFIGLNDDAASGEDVGAEVLANPVDEESLAGMGPDEAILHISPYDMGRVDEDDIKWEDNDPTDERFGKPISYEVDLGKNRPSPEIHWTRLIHVVGNVFDNDFKSSSVLKQSLNRIDDIEKILGGSAEGYWRSAYQGLVISPPEVNGQVTDFSDSGEGLHKQIERYINNFSREIFTPADVESISVDADDPTGFLESQYKDLAAGHDIPQSVLMGNETGERATEQDRRMWHERVSEFREEYCLPAVLRPFIDRLIDLNVFPEPEAGKYAYRVKWPPLDEKSAEDEAELATTKADAVSTGTGGNPLEAMTVGEFREQIMGWDPEVGSMADDAGGMEPATAEDLEIDETDERVQKQFSDMSGLEPEEVEEVLEQARTNEQQYETKDKVTTPDGRGVIVDVLTEGFEAEDAPDVEASEDSPTYVVVTEDPDQPFGFYKADEIEQEDWDVGKDSPADELKESEDEDRENALKVRIERALAAFRGNQEGHFEWPEPWEEADEPARLIALDAWVSMGGDVSACINEMRGEIAAPARFCADFADRLYQWDYWRGDSWAPGE